jgi:hypothetical protein
MLLSLKYAQILDTFSRVHHRVCGRTDFYNSLIRDLGMETSFILPDIDFELLEPAIHLVKFRLQASGIDPSELFAGPLNIDRMVGVYTGHLSQITTDPRVPDSPDFSDAEENVAALIPLFEPIIEMLRLLSEGRV